MALRGDTLARQSHRGVRIAALGAAGFSRPPGGAMGGVLHSPYPALSSVRSGDTA